MIATKTGFETPQPFEEVAASFIFNTEGGNIAFLGDTLYHNGYRMVGQSYKIDVVCMDMGNNAPGYTDKMSPWDVWRVAEALNAKVVIPDHHDNYGNCYEDPSYLDFIVSHKSKEKQIDMRAVISPRRTLLPSGGYEYRTLRLPRLARTYELEKKLGIWAREEIRKRLPSGSL